MGTQETWRELIELLRPIHPSVVATARRLGRSSIDGEDLLQEAVLRAYERLHSLRDRTRFRPWFYAILLSVHRNRARRSFWKRFVPLIRDDGSMIEPACDDGGSWEERRRREERVRKALATLPAVQREAIVLFEIERFSVEEIAIMQKVSISAVKSRLARGRERLRRHYERMGFTARKDPAARPTRSHSGPVFVQELLESVEGTNGRRTEGRPLSEGKRS